MECLRAGHRWLHERGCARETFCTTDYLAYDDARRQELEPAARLRHAGRRQPAILCGTTPSYPRRGYRPDGGRRRSHHPRPEPSAPRPTILTVSTAVMAGRDAIRLPSGTEPWREAAAALPLGRNEKVFLEIGATPRSSRTRMRTATCATPGRPPTRSAPTVGRSSRRSSGAREPSSWRRKARPPASSTCPTQLVALFGSDVASAIRPLAARHGAGWPHRWRLQLRAAWAVEREGAAGPAVRGPAVLRGRATHPFDFTTAHGAHDSGQRAADEVSIRAPRGAVPCDARRLLTGRIMVAASFEHWMIRAARQPANRE